MQTDLLNILDDVEPFHVRDDIRSYGGVAALRLGPVAGQVEVTSSCFQHCRMCDSWRDDLKGVQKGLLHSADLVSVCDDLASFPTFQHLSLTGGDPQAWPHLPAFLGVYQTRRQADVWRFSLQVNTALTQPVQDRKAWLSNFADVRLSLDAITAKTYRRIRGDGKTTPDDVLRHLRQLGHPNVQVLMCVTPDNIQEIQPLLETLAEPNNRQDIRKVTLLPVIGDRYERDAAFWGEFQFQATANADADWPFQTSFADSVPSTRAFLLSDDAKKVRCWTGVSTFHIKANGDWYPCCLVGGEALATYKNMVLGNIHRQPVASIVNEIRQAGAMPHYCDESKPCRHICQYKQAALNVAGHEASQRTLAMP